MGVDGCLYPEILIIKSGVCVTDGEARTVKGPHQRQRCKIRDVLVDNVPDAQAIENQKGIWDFEEKYPAPFCGDACTKPSKQVNRIRQMLEHVAAAHEVGSARIFNSEAAANNLKAAGTGSVSAGRLARIVAFAIIPCCAKQAQEVAAAASDLDDALSSKLIAADDATSRLTRVSSV